MRLLRHGLKGAVNKIRAKLSLQIRFKDGINARSELLGDYGEG